jgi:hypothetical protein
MKKLTIGLFAIVALISTQSIKAQTLDEVVNNYEIANGGKEKLLSLKSVKMIGSLDVQGYEVGVTVTAVNGVGTRNDISVPGMGEGFQVVNTKKGWDFMPFRGQSSPEEISQEQLKYAQALLDLQGLLVNYKEKGNQVELLGKENLSGTECFKLKVTSKIGKVYTLFIDAKTYYRVKMIGKGSSASGEVDIEVSYSDYKKTDDGYVFPYVQTIEAGSIVFKTIEVNKPIDEKIFTVD